MCRSVGKHTAPWTGTACCWPRKSLSHWVPHGAAPSHSTAQHGAACRGDAGTMMEGCRRNANGMQAACKGDVGEMQVGCRQDAGGMQQWPAGSAATAQQEEEQDKIQPKG